MFRVRIVCLWYVLLAAACLPAQVVHVGNLGASPFDGWMRATIDTMPRSKAGVSAGVPWVLGREVGRDARTIDLQVHLEAGELRSIDLAEGRAVEFRRPAPVADELGLPLINGREFALASIREDGAGYLVHLRARTGRMLHTDLWLVWYPGLAWVRGEVVVTCSNPAVPDVAETIPAGGLKLSWPNAIVVVQGAPAQGAGLLFASGETIADGQARSLPVTVAWPSRLGDAGPAGVSGWSSAGAAATGGLAANGISRLYPEGTPAYVGDALAWSRQHRAAALGRLGTWDAGVLGVTAWSGTTGPQEDQVWPGGEMMLGPRSLGCEQACYFVALGQSRRPCHHLERTGDLLRLAEHPQLVLWDGRAHWSDGVSPDRLGKARNLTMPEAHGWWGPDVEHALIGRLYAAHRVNGSPALQWQLQAQARVYLLQWTVRDGLSTSQPYAARAWGWEGILAVRLYEALDDRVLAEQVRTRWQARWDTILRPAAAGEIWDIRADDPRLGSGAWWIPWQQAVGAYGLDLAGRWFGRPAAREAALRGARAVVDRAWRQENGRWTCCEQQAVDGRGTFGGSFRLFGMCLAPQVVLQHEPGHAKARAILDSLLADTNGGAHPWLAPGVR